MRGYDGMGIGQRAHNAFVSGLIGGGTAELAGGNFKDGFVNAALARAVNDDQHFSENGVMSKVSNGAKQIWADLKYAFGNTYDFKLRFGAYGGVSAGFKGIISIDAELDAGSMRATPLEFMEKFGDPNADWNMHQGATLSGGLLGKNSSLHYTAGWERSSYGGTLINKPWNYTNGLSLGAANSSASLTSNDIVLTIGAGAAVGFEFSMNLTNINRPFLGQPILPWSAD